MSYAFDFWKLLRYVSKCTLIALAGFGCSRSQTAALPTSRPSILSSAESSVIGALGMPLGTVVEIRASIVAGHELGNKKDQSSYLLRVTEVNGQSHAPTVMEFSVPGFVTVKIANDNFGLYELRTGQKTGKLESAQIDELERDYVGRPVRLVVYETGGYSGIPRNLPDDVPVWQDHDFAFSTSLVVLAERP